MKPTIFGREPIMYLTVINAALALAVGFGLHLDPAQTGLILAFTSAVLGFVARSQVTPIEKEPAVPADGLP